MMKSSDIRADPDLERYLTELAQELTAKGLRNLAVEVMHASGFYGGSPSEFFHEAEIALGSVRTHARSTLDEPRLADIANVIELIEEAFRKVGGA
jgi:hypothetical protein